jgi:hypothetical protein
MKSIKWIPALVLPIAILTSCTKNEKLPPISSEPSVVSTASAGNGSLSGSHYNLNIIGVPKDKTADMTGNNGGRIFVPLEGSTKINLTPGADFQVLDANGTDGSAAFQLPQDVSANWSVYARAVGTPGGKARITTCAEYAYDGTAIDISLCDYIDISRVKQGKFVNVSKDLLFVTLNADLLDAYGNVVLRAGSYPLFDERLLNYFWQYDNNGLKVLQLRFYPGGTPVDTVPLN